MNKKSALYAASWNVVFRNKEAASILEDRETPFRIIKNAKRYWAADPFLFEHNGEVYVFAELYDYVRRRGGIGYCKLTGDDKPKWKPVIFEKFHMSYPFIFEKDGEIYIMPETFQDNALHLYRAVSFPDVWERCEENVRDNMALADTTVFDWNGRKYALTYYIPDPFHPDLYLLDMDDPSKDKKLTLDHVELRRPAGKHLPGNVRPAQNCKEDYGKGLIFYKYEITEDGGYTEEEICRLFPEDLRYSGKIFLNGMHTYNCCAGYEVVDIHTRRFNLINLFFRIVGKIKK